MDLKTICKFGFQKPVLNKEELSYELQKEKIDNTLDLCRMRLKSITLLEELGNFQDMFLLLRHLVVDISNLLLIINNRDKINAIHEIRDALAQCDGDKLAIEFIGNNQIFDISLREDVEKQDIKNLSITLEKFFYRIEKQAVLVKKKELSTSLDNYKKKVFLWLSIVPLIVLCCFFIGIKIITYIDLPLMSKDLQYNKFIKEWLVLGHISSPYQKSFNIDFLQTDGGETKILPETGMEHKLQNGKIIRWEKYKSDRDVIDFRSIFGDHDDAVGYAFTRLDAPERSQAVFAVGSDDAIKIWLNGVLVHKVHKVRGAKIDGDKVNVQLEEGENTILVKVTQSVGGWKFYFRILEYKQ